MVEPLGAVLAQAMLADAPATAAPCATDAPVRDDHRLDSY